MRRVRRDDAAGVGEKQREDVELLRCELELGVVLPGAVRVGIDANALHLRGDAPGRDARDARGCARAARRGGTAS